MNICIQKNLHTYLHTHTHTHTRNEPAGCGRRWGCDCTWCRRWQLRRHALGAYRGSWQSCSSPPGAPCISSHIRTQGSRLINRRLVRACASSLQRGALARKWPVVVVACARAIARTRALCRRADRHPFFGASGAVCEAPTPCVSRTASATPRLTDTHTRAMRRALTTQCCRAQACAQSASAPGAAAASPLWCRTHSTRE
jgi:hypothetical protein